MIAQYRESLITTVLSWLFNSKGMLTWRNLNDAETPLKAQCHQNDKSWLLHSQYTLSVQSVLVLFSEYTE